MAVDLSPFEDVVKLWCEGEFQIHKRPPFKAYSFDNDHNFWVVGTTHVSVFGAYHDTEERASAIADALNNTIAAKDYLAKASP